MTDAELLALTDDDISAGMFYTHFAHWEHGECQDWPLVADEGVRIWNMLFDYEIVEDTAQDDLLCAMASESHDRALLAVAKCMGLDYEAVKAVVGHWAYDYRKYPVMTPEQFISAVRSYKNSEE